MITVGVFGLLPLLVLPSLYRSEREEPAPALQTPPPPPS
jgi:hypothetical protein